MTPKTEEQHEREARAFMAHLDAAILAVVRDPAAVFRERDGLLHDLRGLLRDAHALGFRAGVKDVKTRIGEL